MGAAVLLLTSACGGGGGTEQVQWADGEPVAESPSAPASPTTPSASPTPTAAARTSRPPATTAAVPTPSRRNTAANTATVRVSLSGGLAWQNGSFSGLHQEGCGDPAWGLVSIRVSDPRNVTAAAFRYQVRTPTPFNGRVSARRINSGGDSWLGSLGPFRADPKNAAGGRITVTAEVTFRDGTRKTAQTSSTLKPCRR
ncbi:hypothetical protein [Plantactinospora sp. CA-290183]|uniref:hypothetical protein n=1 Tax=Plantactinospora sp. CA-290183 TaxID=3240006 RepID=UPI003D8A37A4